MDEEVHENSASFQASLYLFEWLWLSFAWFLLFLQNGLNALHLAAKEGHMDLVQELLDRGAAVDAATKVSFF